ncbi:orotate phosphoribosyltransferase [Thiofilum flexile]|uniref:orotate phosphoribosyltransferase n=1 Tax=Thiofilum flexile TaxID=125627 RepID=UPI000360DCED|nr:orotate phosphoribosyltransferase [Thiofilum flexile]
MQYDPTAFIPFALGQGVLKFGEFTLKSGRVSPYFFNAGLFQTGAALSQLGHFYAQAIVEAECEFDMLFGPAYKGIPLVVATAMALYEQYGRDVPYAFNRKEAKTHGEGGNIVGMPLSGRVLVIDDVMTAGTAIRESALLVQQANAQLAGVVIALDRRERGVGALSAVQEVEQTFKIPVTSIVNLEQISAYIQQHVQDPLLIERIQAYRAEYGI